ncbi:MAG: DNA primase [Actinobacteria bacterium]|nr:DNA primase [Actinomycetota bacterium]MCL6105166.1 DNA primase [Actinomycetota bacterium]
MTISDEDIEKVRQDTDLVALVSEHIALKRQGRRWVGLCPFHAEKTPSFSVNAEAGLYYCFGCHASGDAITFMRAMEGMDFGQAVRSLADKVGISLRFSDNKDSIDAKNRKKLFEVMKTAVEWYHKRLLESSDAAHARSYLHSRGLSEEQIGFFRLGWAPSSWDLLAKDLTSNSPTKNYPSYSKDLLIAAGLCTVNSYQKLQDVFRGRIIFPIFDTSNRPIALAGRTLDGVGAGNASKVSDFGSAKVKSSSLGPKYYNSPETPIYSKRKVLYGLNWAKSEVVKTDQIIVCEGYFDVMAFFHAGFENAVATCGTALSEEHFKSLRNFAKTVVLAYDSDSAGQAGMEAFYQWERNFELDVKVVDLPKGQDPADIGFSDPNKLADILSNAKPFLGFKIHRIFSSLNLSTPEGRAKGAELALAQIAQHPSEFVRDQYLMVVASHCLIDENNLRQRLERLRKGSSDSTFGASTVASSNKMEYDQHASLRLELLRLVVNNSNQVKEQLTSMLQAAGFDDISAVLSPLAELLFNKQVARDIFCSVLAASEPRKVFALLPQEAQDLLGKLIAVHTVSDPQEVISLLIKQVSSQMLIKMSNQAKFESDSDAHKALNSLIIEVRMCLVKVDDPATRLKATGDLLAWLLRS